MGSVIGIIVHCVIETVNGYHHETINQREECKTEEVNAEKEPALHKGSKRTLSTDEDKSEQEKRQQHDTADVIDPKRKFTRHTFRKWIGKDTDTYRHGYPGKRDTPGLRNNYRFYTNTMESLPDGGFIEDILKDWYGDYQKLEDHHGYIQWLFPIREQGVNIQAQELQLHEVEDMRKEPEVLDRIRRSYEMMLDFYGLKLVDKDKGIVERSAGWKGRFAHLNRSMHNYLRITRILKSLGELGYEHYKVPFLDYILTEIFVKNTLPNCADSCMDYWVNTVRDTSERDRLCEAANEYYE